jgi:hypothetical protein
MISRLTTVAALFSVLATASLTYAATTQHQASTSPPVAAAKQVRIVQLQPVVIIAKRI